MCTLPKLPAEHNTPSGNCRRTDANIVVALKRCEASSSADIFSLRGIGWAPVAFDRNARFVFAWEAMPGDALEHAFIIPSFDADGELMDIVAWLPGRTPATWIGAASILGAQNLYSPRPGLAEALDVHETVAKFLAAGQEGIVLLNYRRAADEIEGLALAVKTVAFGQQLRERLSWINPQIVVRRTHA
jgi:hypothetical protein